MPYAAKRICPRPSCPHVQPCPIHARPAWGGTSQAQRTGKRGLDNGTRQRILQRDGYVCQACGKRGATHVDHRGPRFEGGTDDDANLVTLCEQCHARKSGREGNRASRARRSQENRP